jgi:phosphoribosylamine--glycine ligase
MKHSNLTAAIIGKDGRTSAIERRLTESTRLGKPAIRISDWKSDPREARKQNALSRAREAKPDFVVVGPEDPLADGIVDELQALGIPCVGPIKILAQLESSKAFTRQLLSKHAIPGNPEHRIFRSEKGIKEYLEQLGEYVVKPDGLTAGKGVKLSGAHLNSTEDALRYCRELLSAHAAVLIEEKLDGEEFSLQSFCDGTHIKHMVVVQDHKRAFEGDLGPNTGGMGSYSCEDHSLPFLLPEHVAEAEKINAAVMEAALKETGQKYKGILYGGFMATGAGIRLIEYNARFGDPETLNVLSVLRTDLVDIFEAIIEETLDKLAIEFAKLATVCKYIVPEGYPDQPVRGKQMDLSAVPPESAHFRMYPAAVETRPNGEVYMTGSRAVAFVGIGKDLSEAEAIAERAASAVRGPVYHRADIGTQQLIQKRVEHMRRLRSKERS